ncbi:O-methyltransferase [Geosporobacter ferrireducens]|uniref:tRNA 5-hydroxyuridine methyltransferase n=1 Tax=Geosporobacter ferrireducens TaxID=1424294 RepID=A0A1D8GPN6_9FIRM|nr:O-methyltransferase [Geosporobacter ferrireducens]AOT72867.1 methyltransferase [Geosporobacter ferrireducens]
MSNIVNPLIEEYIRNTICKNEGLLKEMEEYALENHVPIVQPEVSKLLEVITKIQGAKDILEVGTAIGYSAIIFCQSSDGGKVTTIERRADMIEKAQTYIATAGLSSSINILQGSAEEVLPSLEGTYDLIFLDAAKGQYMEFLASCIHLLKPGGVLISDNVLYKGMVASNEYVIRRKKTIVKRMRTYLDYIMENPKLVSCLLPIGDGVAISYKNKEA